MGRMTVQDAIAYLKRVGFFAAKEWPQLRLALQKLSPPDFERVADGLSDLDTTQESAKGVSVPLSGELDKILGQAYNLAKGGLKIARGRLEASGQTDRLEDVPALKGKSFEARIASLKQVCAYLGGFKDASTVDVKQLGELIRKAEQLKPKVRSAVKATKPTTQELDARQDREISNAAAWVQLIEAAGRLTGRPEIAESAPRQETTPGRRRKAQPPAAGGPG